MKNAETMIRKKNVNDERSRQIPEGFPQSLSSSAEYAMPNQEGCASYTQNIPDHKNERKDRSSMPCEGRAQVEE